MKPSQQRVDNGGGKKGKVAKEQEVERFKQNNETVIAKRRVSGEPLSSFHGVSWEPHLGRFRVRIKSDGHNVSVGCYLDEEEAARAWDNAARRMHGAKAHGLHMGMVTILLNFPTPHEEAAFRKQHHLDTNKEIARESSDEDSSSSEDPHYSASSLDQAGVSSADTSNPGIGKYSTHRNQSVATASSTQPRLRAGDRGE
jgi:hypothetical protein